MAPEDQVSPRLVEQRMRNRVMETLETLADGDAGVRQVGVVEYFETFYDWIDDESPWRWRTWSVFTPDEVVGLARVLALMDAAARGTAWDIWADDLIASGWPARIQPVAAATLRLMSARGRFSEELEQAEPHHHPQNHRPVN